jgi:hypothetical protein
LARTHVQVAQRPMHAHDDPRVIEGEYVVLRNDAATLKH